VQAEAPVVAVQLKLNTDESPGVATEYGIRSIPTVMVFKVSLVAAPPLFCPLLPRPLLRGLGIDAFWLA
jgi:hypothetical protein